MIVISKRILFINLSANFINNLLNKLTYLYQSPITFCISANYKYGKATTWISVYY